IPKIRSTAGVLSVAPVTRHYVDAVRIHNEDSVPWIGGDAVKSLGYTGNGVTIAIIDTGIDYTHAAFGGSGDPADYAANDPDVVEADTFPTAKVIGGYDFAGPDYDPCAATPIDIPDPDDDPLDGNGHGTHGAATAAGLGAAGHGEGMAPDAQLYALKVFNDTEGCTELTAEAIEWAMDPNDDGDTSDRVDVINMSLGAGYGSSNDVSAIAAQNAVNAGIVVVASSGNSGPIPYITGAPAVADGAISVAASIDDAYEVNGIAVNSPVELDGEYPAAIGQFGELAIPLAGDLEVMDPSTMLGCDPEDVVDLTGKIAFVSRGDCTFTTKVRNAEAAGAIAVMIFNNTDGPPPVMPHDGTDTEPTIAAVMIPRDIGLLFLDHIDDGDTFNVTLSPEITVIMDELADRIADFSSKGPGHGNAFKLDV